MNILILGGSGFIGSRVAKILRERQHNVTTPSHAELDLMRLDLDAAQRLLRGQDCVVNCVGVMSRHADVLEQVHHHAPQQLAHLARAVGVPTWVQLSALGADAAHEVAFVGSKGRGDAAVCASGLRVNIARRCGAGVGEYGGAAVAAWRGGEHGGQPENHVGGVFGDFAANAASSRCACGVGVAHGVAAPCVAANEYCEQWLFVARQPEIAGARLGGGYGGFCAGVGA